MGKRDGVVRLQAQFEGIQISDSRICGEEDFDRTIGTLKLKLFGR